MVPRRNNLKPYLEAESPNACNQTINPPGLQVAKVAEFSCSQKCSGPAGQPTQQFNGWHFVPKLGQQLLPKNDDTIITIRNTTTNNDNNNRPHHYSRTWKFSALVLSHTALGYRESYQKMVQKMAARAGTLVDTMRLLWSLLWCTESISRGLLQSGSFFTHLSYLGVVVLQ